MTNAPSMHRDYGDSMTAPPRLANVDEDDLLCLVASAEPAVAFSSLARLCVPAFSDTCTVDIIEHERAAYRITYPQASNVGDDYSEPKHGLSTRFESSPGDNGPAYFGVATFTWREHTATAADAAYAQLLIERAVAAVTDGRRADLGCN